MQKLIQSFLILVCSNVTKQFNSDGLLIAKNQFFKRDFVYFTGMNEENVDLQEKMYSTLQIDQRIIYSEYLEREVFVDVYVPFSFNESKEIPLLLVNDGQDLPVMNFGVILDSLLVESSIEPIMCIGIHCGGDRMNEYGTVCRTDYKGRGAKAGLYNKFIFDELLPYLSREYDTYTFKEKSFAGFSLGALSALDIVWNHPQEFTKVGVFSGSLWWRRRGYDDKDYSWDNDRIMHLQVQKGAHFPWLNFFFECGLLDETADRNNNGVIDSIDDVMDLIEDLKVVGYSESQIHYLELEDGKHNVETWGRAFPAFLKWGWGKGL